VKLYLQLFRSIIGYLRWRVWALTLLMVLVSLSEGLSVTLLLPLLSRVGISYAPNQGVTGTIMSSLIAALGTSASTLYLLVVLILVALVQAALFMTLQ